MLAYHQPMSIATTAIASGLTPYTGTFGRAEAWHLLRRTTFGVDLDAVVDAAGSGLEATLDQLLNAADTFGPPLNAQEALDPNVPIGGTWITAPYLDSVDVNIYRSRSLQSWQLESYYTGGVDLRAKMSLFWHNHFSCIRNGDARWYYQYLQLLRDNALGNFRELIRAICTNGQMLIFLNGNSNTKNSPNENFARELLELFTLGKGPQIGSGDYTNYTEDDVRALAKALTGWRTLNAGSTDPNKQPVSEFFSQRHDESDQQLSARLGNAVIVGAAESAHNQVVDVLFAQAAAADFICRKLYRWFVYYDISPQVEQDVIQPLAALMRQLDFAVAPVLRALLSSEHFFAPEFRGAMIKSPVDHAIDLTAGLGLELPPGVEERYEIYRRLNWPCNDQLMKLWVPPSVAGWKAYYQAPLYARSWINASTLKTRTELGNRVAGSGWTHGDAPIKTDFLAYIAGFANPSDPNELVAEFVERLLPKPLAQAQLDSLKDVLIPGLPDFEWTVEYTDHLADPADENLANSVSRKVRGLVKAIVNSAEINLS